MSCYKTLTPNSYNKNEIKVESFFFLFSLLLLGLSIHRGPTWQVDVQRDSGDILQTLPAAEHGHGGLHGQPQ